MTAYYNEIDKFAAQWLRNLISEGLIADGYVDERSIEDVRPDDLLGFTQCHFFAGIGGWSIALRRAGWPDDSPVWTASCPCQPFSAAGVSAGFNDPRHLYPTLSRLIKERKPTVIFGEQVASKAADPWVDLVQADLEAMDYAFGCIAFPSAGVGAPHIRDRTYWMGHSNNEGLEGHAWNGSPKGREGQGGSASEAGLPLRVADSKGGGWVEECSYAGGGYEGDNEEGLPAGSLHGGPSNGVADANSQRLNGFNPLLQWEESRRIAGDSIEAYGRGPVNGFWRGSDWLSCRDDRWRPVEPGTFPLVARIPAGMGSVQPGLSRLYGRNRTGRLKGYGNAINVEAAKVFIESAMESLSEYGSVLSDVNRRD